MIAPMPSNSSHTPTTNNYQHKTHLNNASSSTKEASLYPISNIQQDYRTLSSSTTPIPFTPKPNKTKQHKQRKQPYPLISQTSTLLILSIFSTHQILFYSFLISLCIHVRLLHMLILYFDINTSIPIKSYISSRKHAKLTCLIDACPSKPPHQSFACIQ